MGSIGQIRNDESISLEYLVTIWPVVENLAIHLPLGDLITLARTSRGLRAGLHGYQPNGTEQSSNERQIHLELIPHLGQHQTSYWKHLKHISPFGCVNKVHTKGQKLRPCVYCSRPICDACIVRDSFKKGKEDTFKNRLRYFCRECWVEGKPTKAHRYSAVTTNHSDGKYDGFKSVGEHLDSTNADSFCSCTLKDNGWLCIECKDWQNNFDAPNAGRSATPIQVTQCYALDCENPIDQSFATRDRQRICLWCQKPLRRQYGGEDRHAWNQKTVTARAINAEFRSRDIEEYNRQRWRGLKMSRNEMRGGHGGPQDNRLDFVRHLDTVNYLATRHRLKQTENPTPDAVYKSKNGIWQYQRDFLLAFGRVCGYTGFKLPGLDTEGLREFTGEGALPLARTNKMLQNGLVITKPRHVKGDSVAREVETQWNTLRTRIINIVKETTQEDDIKGHEDQICESILEQYDLNLTKSAFRNLWETWQFQHKHDTTKTVEDDRSKKRSRLLRDIDLSLYIRSGGNSEADETTPIDTAINQSNDPSNSSDMIQETIRPAVTITPRREAYSSLPPSDAANITIPPSNPIEAITTIPRVEVLNRAPSYNNTETEMEATNNINLSPPAPPPPLPPTTDEPPSYIP